MKKIYINGINNRNGRNVTCGCDTEANRVSYNLSQEADNFNVIRQLTVINCIQGDVLFQMTGKMSIKADATDNQLEVVVEDEKRHLSKALHRIK